MMPSLTKPFDSFLMAGFECTGAMDERKKRLTLLFDTQHDKKARDDYRLMKEIGIHTVREGLNWSRIDMGRGQYDFSLFQPILQAGVDERIQQIWDLNHFDYPEYIDPFADTFPEAFGLYAVEAVKFLRKYIKDTLYILPINEISFFSWIGADRGVWAPYTKGSGNGFRFKQQLVKAVIRAVSEIRKIDGDVKFIHSDPYMRRVPRPDSGKTAVNHCNEFNEIIRFEAWDMLFGKKMPELGGSPEIVDYIGMNYYIHNQEWVWTEKSRALRFAHMERGDPARVDVGVLLQELYDRYQKPLLISETGSYDMNRPDWWKIILTEVKMAREIVPVEGVCAYPILDRPDWSGFLLPKSGLWDFDQTRTDYDRIPHDDSLQVIRSFSF